MRNTPRAAASRVPLAPFFPYFSLPLVFLCNTPARHWLFTRVATFPCSANLRLRRVTLDRVLLRVETSLRFFASTAKTGLHRTCLSGSVGCAQNYIARISLQQRKTCGKELSSCVKINQSENGRNFSCVNQNLKLINYFRGYWDWSCASRIEIILLI